MILHGPLNIRFNKSLWKDKIAQGFIAPAGAKGQCKNKATVFPTSYNLGFDLIK